MWILINLLTKQPKIWKRKVSLCRIINEIDQQESEDNIEDIYFKNAVRLRKINSKFKINANMDKNKNNLLNFDSKNQNKFQEAQQNEVKREKF